MVYVFIIRSSMKPITCLCSRFCVSEGTKLYHTYTMFIFWIMCIKKRETASYIQFVYDLDCVYQKEENCVMYTICLWSRFRVAARGKLYHTHSMLWSIPCASDRENRIIPTLYLVSFVGFVYQTEGNCIIPAVCYDLYLVHLIEKTVSYLHYI
jgi:hypothetical protein